MIRRSEPVKAALDRRDLERSVVLVVVLLTAGLVLSWVITAVLMHLVRGGLEEA